MRQQLAPEPHKQIKVRVSTRDALADAKIANDFGSFDSLLRHLLRVVRRRPELLREGRGT